jgi:uncharacterized Zn ribbon protein
MRPFLLTLCLTVLLGSLAFTTGCSKQWQNPAIEDSAQADAQFTKDSRACDLMAGEQYPLDKDMQYKVYSKCMTDKGWVQRDGDGYRFNTGKKK